jgi:hypothetical protein
MGIIYESLPGCNRAINILSEVFNPGELNNQVRTFDKNFYGCKEATIAQQFLLSGEEHILPVPQQLKIVKTKIITKSKRI